MKSVSQSPRFRSTVQPTVPASLSATGGKRSMTSFPRMGRRSFTTMGAIQSASQGRLESSWSSTPKTADAIVYQSWLTTTARARQASHDYDHYGKYVQLIRDNVAGPDGFNLNPSIKDQSGTIDRAAGKALEEAYDDFSLPGNFEVTGQFSRSEFERQAASTYATDGEVIVLVKYGDKYPHGIAFQMIDPVRLDPTMYHKLSNGNVVRHGIEMDEDNRPVNYWFRDYDEMQVGYITHQGQGFTVVPASNIIHWFLPELVGLKRGLCPGRRALWRMRMLSGFDDAVITNARIGAAKMGFFKDLDADGDEDEDFEIEAEPGTFEDIGNREFQTWNPQFPDQAIDPFERILLRSISSGLLVSYHNLSGDLSSVNFSSIRQGSLDERTMWKGLQKSFSLGLCYKMFLKWLEVALLRKIPRVNGNPLRFERIDKYKRVAFFGRRWEWIDPAAEQSANAQAVGQGFKSRSEVIRETSNRDPEEVFDEIEAENKELRKRGIVPVIPSGSTLPQQPSNKAGAKEPANNQDNNE